jgi:hypothetical protein
MSPIEIRATSFTPHGERILAILRQRGEWMSRTAIAAELSKSRLNKWEIVLCGWLVEHGYAEARKVERPGAIGWEWQYRAKQE